MEEFIAYLVKNLVSHPEKVSISCKEDETEIRLDIRVADEDAGKVIGRKGNTINALRTICRTVAARLGKRAQLELIQENRPPQGAMPAKEVVSQDEESTTEEIPQVEAFAEEEILEEGILVEEVALQEEATAAEDAPAHEESPAVC